MMVILALEKLESVDWPAWATQQVPGLSELHGKTVSKKKEKLRKQRKDHGQRVYATVNFRNIFLKIIHLSFQQISF